MHCLNGGPARENLGFMADRHLVTIDVNGQPATFATAGENAWKDSVRSAVEATGVQAQGGSFALRMEFRLPCPGASTGPR